MDSSMRPRIFPGQELQQNGIYATKGFMQPVFSSGRMKVWLKGFST